MHDIIGRLGNNFIIAAFIPALGFVLSATLLFDPLIPQVIRERLSFSLQNPFAENAVFSLVLTVLIGFTLLSLNTFIYKLLEGYIFLERFSFWRKRQYKKALRRRMFIALIDKAARDFHESQLRSEAQQQRLQEKISLLQQRSDSLKAAYQQDYPKQTRLILPTRFGNILRAAEVYPNEHYGIDAVTMWPRLIHVMAPEYYDKVDESNNGLAFVVNSMVLALMLALLCLFASAYQYSTWQYAINQAEAQRVAWEQQTREPNEVIEYNEVRPVYFMSLRVDPISRQAYQQRSWIYLATSIILIGVTYFFYNASLPAARQYGNMIRSAYDLFRFDLMEQFRLPLPADSDLEHQDWKLWSEFIALGDFEGAREPFKYQHPHHGPAHNV